MNTKTQPPAQPRASVPQPQPRAITGSGAAGAKLKTFGAFTAGGLVSAVITTALLHGWGVLTSNGLNPFGDGGKSAYKDTDAQTGTAPKAGLAVRPAPTIGQGQGMDGQAATPVVMVQGLWPAITPAPAAVPSAAQASTVGVAVGFVPTTAAHQTGQPAQPVLARGEALEQAPAVAPVTTTAAAPKPAARTGSKPAAASASGGNVGGNKPAAGGVAGTGGTASGNWVAALMPGEAKAAPSPYYYEYTAQKGGKSHAVTQQKTTLPAASGNNWVASLMGNQPVKRTAGRASPYQTTSTALGSAAGVGGDRLTGGGEDHVWAKGDVEVPPKDPRKSRISVCTETRGMVSACVTEDF